MSQTLEELLLYMQTLTDKEYQRLRDAAVAIIREMGVECGGSNVQMGINPEDGGFHCTRAAVLQICNMHWCISGLCIAPH